MDNVPRMAGVRTLIAVVDDDPAIVTAIARLLRLSDFEVVTFTSPQRSLLSDGAIDRTLAPLVKRRVLLELPEGYL